MAELLLLKFKKVKKVLEKTSTLIYNLLRKVIGRDADLPSVILNYRNSIHFGRRMLFLFAIMIIYVRQCRKNY